MQQAGSRGTLLQVEANHYVPKHTLMPASAGPSASLLTRVKRAGLARCADAGPVVLMRSRLVDGRTRLGCDEAASEKPLLLLRRPCSSCEVSAYVELQRSYWLSLHVSFERSHVITHKPCGCCMSCKIFAMLRHMRTSKCAAASSGWAQTRQMPSSAASSSTCRQAQPHN